METVLRGYLIVTVFLCGAAVMLIEIVAARLIAPYFGSSIFVWTAVISVTLISLALGYFFGGKFADRTRSPAVLYGVVGLAAAYLFLAIFSKKLVLSSCMDMGLRLGALVSSSVLFALPLFLLGMVSPFSVKLYTRSLERIGSGVGILYFFSTAGSFLGTLLAGFVLIPRFGSTRILLFTADALIFLSLLYLVAFSRRYQALLMLVIIPLNPFALRLEGLRSAIIGHNYWQQVYRSESFYTDIKVIEVNNASRFLVTDGTNQGGLDILSGYSQATYSYAIDALLQMGSPGMKRVLVIGLGSGVIPHALSKRGVKVDVVEIDPRIVELYHRYFSIYGKPGNISVTVADGRRFLKGKDSLYDAVVLDVFVGDSSPWHLLTVEAFLEIESVLTKDGCLVINFVGSPRDPDGARIIASIHKTLARVFTHSLVFNSTRSVPEEARNILYLATLAEPALEPLPSLFIPYPQIKEEVDGMLSDCRFEPAQGAFLLTDEYNPVDFYNAGAKESWRRTIMQNQARDMVID